MPASLLLVSDKFRILQVPPLAKSPGTVIVLRDTIITGLVAFSAPEVTPRPAPEDVVTARHRGFPHTPHQQRCPYLLLIIRIALFTVGSGGNFVTAGKGVGRIRDLIFFNYKTTYTHMTYLACSMYK